MVGREITKTTFENFHYFSVLVKDFTLPPFSRSPYNSISITPSGELGFGLTALVYLRHLLHNVHF